MLSKKDRQLCEETCKHIPAIFIGVVQIEIFVLGIVKLVGIEDLCYNDLILIGGVVLIVEMCLSVLRYMGKHKIWFRVVVLVLLFSFINILALLLASGINNSVGVAIVGGLNVYAYKATSKTHDRIARERKRSTSLIKQEMRAIEEACIVAFIASVALLDYVDVLRLEWLDTATTIAFGVIGISMFLVLYFEIAGILQRQIIEEHKADADVIELLNTYKNGSVFLSYPVTSQAIGDLLDYRVLRVRNPKAANLSSDVGAWYTITRSHYDQIVNEKDSAEEDASAE